MCPRWRGPHGHHAPPTLYRRFYVHTLLVVVVCIAAVFTLGAWNRTQAFRKELHLIGAGVGRLVAEQLAPSVGDPAELQRAVARVAGLLNARFTVFDAGKKPLASAGDPLPAPPAAEFDEAVRSGAAVGWQRHQGHWVVVPIERGGSRVGFLQGALAFHLEPTSLWRFAGSLALLLVLVALFMAPAARSVTRPLEELTESARRFGTGDFAHRVPVRGRDEIARLAGAMNEMAERLSAMMHTQRELLASVSHELRSPLARMQVALELARGQAKPDGALDAIAQDIAELTGLVDDVLATSRLELKPESARPARFSPRDLLERAGRRAVAGGLEAARLTVEAGDLPDVHADPELCAHALGNLLDNARKHTPAGTKVTLGAVREGDRVRLFVRDAGPGLPAEELPRLFEPFYRPDASRSRESGGGAGLGLSLVRRIAELHGGEPRVESAPGKGTTFSFTLPVDAEAEAAG